MRKHELWDDAYVPLLGIWVEGTRRHHPKGSTENEFDLESLWESETSGRFYGRQQERQTGTPQRCGGRRYWRRERALGMELHGTLQVQKWQKGDCSFLREEENSSRQKYHKNTGEEEPFRIFQVPRKDQSIALIKEDTKLYGRLW